MRIVDCRTYVVANPPPSFGGRWFLFVELDTDDGLTGLGEAYSPAVAPQLGARVVEDVCARHLVGASPFDIETFVRRARGAGYSLRPDPTIMSAVSALEMACWDLVGKAVDRPVHALLGGRVHERLRGYSYLYPEPGDTRDVYADPDLAAERAARYVARGFTAVKFDPAGPYTVFDGHQPSRADLSRTETFLTRLREAVGDRADLLLGTHGQFTAAGALRLARRIEAADPLWFEEPVGPTDEAGMARVVAGTRIPVAAGERLTTLAEFDRLLACGVAVVQPNLGRAGGLLEGKKIAALADLRGAQLAPHLYCGPVVGAANIQLAVASPNFLVLEGIGAWDGFHGDLLKTPIRFEDGHVIPSTAPGLGVELDHAVVAAHPWSGTELHLDMSGVPAV